MATPALALLWEWWRTTRRQVLFCGALGILVGSAILASAGNEGVFPAFLLLVSIAVVAWGSTLSRSGRAGFPQPLAFVRPVRTSGLVAVAMFYVAGACAATYAIPAIVLRTAFGAPLPLLPVAVLIGAGAALFCASNWFTRTNPPRRIAIVALVLGIGPVLRWLDPWKAAPSPTMVPVVTVDSIQLGLAEYAAIAIAVAVAFAATVYGVNEQRHDGGAARPLRGPAAQGPRAAPKGLVEQFRDALLGLVRVPCPTSSPLAAELWLETKARGLPIVAIGAVLAPCIPLLLAFADQPQMYGIGLTFVGVAIVLPFFAGMSVSFWNRDSTLRAPMNVFEAVRPAATTRLAAVQIAVAVTSILGAWLLLGASLWLSLPHFRQTVDSAPLQRALVAALAAWPAVRLVLAPIVTIVALATVVALLAAVRAYSVRHGKWVWLGALGVAAYAIGLGAAVGSASESLSAALIGVHFWALALAIPLLTALVILRALKHGLFSLAVCAGMLAAWVAFAAAAAYLTHDFGFVLTALPNATAALAVASLVLPLTAAVLAPWSLRSIRHV
jgi:hypothetical protein